MWSLSRRSHHLGGLAIRPDEASEIPAKACDQAKKNWLWKVTKTFIQHEYWYEYWYRTLSLFELEKYDTFQSLCYAWFASFLGRSRQTNSSDDMGEWSLVWRSVCHYLAVCHFVHAVGPWRALTDRDKQLKTVGLEILWEVATVRGPVFTNANSSHTMCSVNLTCAYVSHNFIELMYHHFT